MSRRDVLDELREMRKRFTTCALRNGSDPDYVELACVDFDTAVGAVVELLEASGLRVDWCNGSWYVYTADGSAFSNVARDEAGARAEATEALQAARARFGGAA